MVFVWSASLLCVLLVAALDRITFTESATKPTSLDAADAALKVDASVERLGVPRKPTRRLLVNTTSADEVDRVGDYPFKSFKVLTDGVADDGELEAAINFVTQNNATDLFIAVHGFVNTEAYALSLYQSLFANMSQVQSEFKGELENLSGRRLVVLGVFWPSLQSNVGLNDLDGKVYDSIMTFATNALDVEVAANVTHEVEAGVWDYLQFFKMTNRAGDVGAVAVRTVARQITEAVPGIQLHLVGHSLGALAVTSAAVGPGDDAPQNFATMTLLQGALSQHSFSASFPGWEHPPTEQKGWANVLLVNRTIMGPTLITTSSHDYTISIAYSTASHLVRNDGRRRPSVRFEKLNTVLDALGAIVGGMLAAANAKDGTVSNADAANLTAIATGQLETSDPAEHSPVREWIRGFVNESYLDPSWGGLGFRGAAPLPDSDNNKTFMLAPGEVYLQLSDLQAPLFELNSSSFIAGHSDITGDAVGWAILSVVNSTPPQGEAAPESAPESVSSVPTAVHLAMSASIAAGLVMTVCA